MKKRTTEWGPKHQAEALRRTYEIAAGMVDGDQVLAGRLGRIAAAHMLEASWRAFLAGDGGRTVTGLDPARIDREVRRVRALAEGRLEREVVWQYVTDDEEREVVARGVTMSAVRDGMEDQDLVYEEHRRVRVTRIRRAAR